MEISADLETVYRADGSERVFPNPESRLLFSGREQPAYEMYGDRISGSGD